MSNRQTVIAGITLTLGLFLPAAARAGAAGQLGPVLDQQVRLELSLARVINEALTRIAGPDRASAVVSVKLEGRLVEQKAVKQARGVSFTMGRVSSSRKVKLPGLPAMGQMGKIAQPVKIRLDPKGKPESRTELLTEVKQVRVRLYVDPDLPAVRLKVIKAAVVDLAGLDPNRGDELEVIKLEQLEEKVQETRVAPAPWRTPVYLALGILPLALLIAAVVIAIGLARGGAKAERGGKTVLEGKLEGAGGELGGAERGLAGAAGGAGPELTPEEAAGRGERLAALARVTGAELAHVLEGLDRKQAATVLALAPISADALREAMEGLEPGKRARIAGSLGQERIVRTEDLGQLDERCVELLDEARNPSEITVGGTELLTRLLNVSSRAISRAILEQLEQIDGELARRARGELTQFEDLPKLSQSDRRRAVSSVDVSVLAAALHRASKEITEAVQQVLSKRQSKYLDEERKMFDDFTEEQVEAAREKIQRVMASL